MGRCIRTEVPQIEKYLTPDWPHLKDFREDKQYKLQQKRYYDQRRYIRVDLLKATSLLVLTQQLIMFSADPDWTG